MIRFGIRCSGFGVEVLLGSSKFGKWHDHDWDAVTLFPGRLVEETEKGFKSHWFFCKVPFHRWHRVRFPWAMLVVHGKKIQDHVELDDKHYRTAVGIRRFGGVLRALVDQKNKELSC